MRLSLQKSYFLLISLSAVLLNAKEVTITSKDDFQRLLDRKETGVVKFSMTGCKHCTDCKNDFQAASRDPKLRDFVFGNAHDSQAAHFQGITGYPSFVYIVDGIVVETEKGAEDNLKEHIKRKLLGLRAQASTQTHVDAQSAPVTVDAPAIPVAIDAAETEAEAESFLAKIYGLIVMILTKVKELVTGILDWITGLFGN